MYVTTPAAQLRQVVDDGELKENGSLLGIIRKS